MTTNKLPKGITQRGDSYRVSIMVDGKRTTATFTTLQEAKDAAEDIRKGTFEAETSSNWTLPEALDQYITLHLEPGGFSEGTREGYESRGRRMTDFFGGDKALENITAHDLARYNSDMRTQRDLKTGTIQGDLVLLKSLMKFAKKMGGMKGIIPDSPKFKKQTKVPRFLTPEEEVAILGFFTHAGDQDMVDVVTVLIDTGLRVAREGLPMKPEHVDLKRNVILIPDSKSSTPRSVPLTKRARTILKRRMLAAKPGRGPFGTLRYHTIAQRWRNMRDALDLASSEKSFTFHICRHTFCTRLVSAGIDLKTVQTLAGHEDITTTMNYVHFIPKEMFKITDALESQAIPKGDPKGNLKVIK